MFQVLCQSFLPKSDRTVSEKAGKKSFGVGDFAENAGTAELYRLPLWQRSLLVTFSMTSWRNGKWFVLKTQSVRNALWHGWLTGTTSQPSFWPVDQQNELHRIAGLLALRALDSLIPTSNLGGGEPLSVRP